MNFKASQRATGGVSQSAWKNSMHLLSAQTFWALIGRFFLTYNTFHLFNDNIQEKMQKY